MIQRLYVHNYRCLVNMEVPLADRPNVLLVGRNGVGKSTLLNAVKVLRDIGCGVNRVRDLVAVSDLADFGSGRAEEADRRMRLEIEAALPGGSCVVYSLALELPVGFRELRVAEECLLADGAEVYRRHAAEVTLTRAGGRQAAFPIDWHQVALPVIQQTETDHPLARFRNWLQGLLVLQPVPRLMGSESIVGTLLPDDSCANFAAWFREVTSQYPASYAPFYEYLRAISPDLLSVQNRAVGAEARSLEFVYGRNGGSRLTVPFGELSDGEKCQAIAALVVAISEAVAPPVCFWDEPDNFVGMADVGHLVMSLRRRLRGMGQFIATSHNAEAIRRFSDENTLLLDRASHLEPPRLRPVSELGLHGDLADILARGGEDR
ncbi:MAG: ATP-binding protein [Armatimonadetes bacterium]|nr:ATP-binding protein [Armatimonadota bacterium]